jgi:hypothetical protein
LSEKPVDVRKQGEIFCRNATEFGLACELNDKIQDKSLKVRCKRHEASFEEDKVMLVCAYEFMLVLMTFRLVTLKQIQESRSSGELQFYVPRIFEGPCMDLTLRQPSVPEFRGGY